MSKDDNNKLNKDNNGPWNEYANLVLQKLSDHEDAITNLTKQIKDLEIENAKTKLKVSLIAFGISTFTTLLVGLIVAAFKGWIA